MWYVYNAEGIIFATCSGEPDAPDLATRGEAAFYSPEIYDLGWRVIFDDDGRPVGAEPPDKE